MLLALPRVPWYAKCEVFLVRAEVWEFGPLEVQQFAVEGVELEFLELSALMLGFFEALQGIGGSKRGAVVCSWGNVLLACLPLLL